MKNQASLLLALIVTAFAILVQQVLSLVLSVMNLVPTMATSVELKHGKILLDGTRSMSLFELPIAGTGLLWGCLAGITIIFIGAYFMARRSLDDLNFKTFSLRLMAPWVVAYVAFGFLGFWLESNYPMFRSDSMTSMIQASKNNPILALLGIGVAAPFFEELVFRGWLFKRMQLIFGAMAAIIATSLLFTIIHLQYNAYILCALFVLALILGMMRHKTGSIWPSIIIHCLNNTIATLVAFNQM